MTGNQNCSLLLKVWRTEPGRRWLAVEATIWLAVSRLAIVVLPFRTIGWLASRQVRCADPKPEVRSVVVKRIRWAVVACAGRVPWRALCFEQGLTAQFMLRRRGIPSVLYYGATLDAEGSLIAHVWVRDGDVDVVGTDEAERFKLLTSFPAEGQPG